MSKEFHSSEKVEFSSEGERLVGIFHFPQRSEARRNSIVITCHGLMSSKDSQKYREIAELLSHKGFAVLRFDFRGSGESEGSGNSLSKRIMDLEAARKFVIDRGYRSIGLVGSSYGGATAILVASQTPEVKCLITWSTPCKLMELFDSIDMQEGKDRSRDSRQVSKSTESFQFEEDLSKHDVAEAAKRVNKILVIHCKGDKVVPWSQARIIYQNAKKPKHLKIFEKGDHQLTNPSIRKEALALSVDWLTTYL